MSVYLGKVPVGVVVSVVDDMDFNRAYAMQSDLFSEINGGPDVNAEDYSDDELLRIEQILKNITEGTNGKV